MESILEISFHLRKPYNEAEKLIESFNQIIEEGGRCEICLTSVPLSDSVESDSSIGHVLQLKMYRCRNTYTAASLGAKVIDTYLTKKDFINITKFNFASIYYCPIKFSIKEPDDKLHGPIISVSLFENKDPDIQNNINQHFGFIDLSSR